MDKTALFFAMLLPVFAGTCAAAGVPADSTLPACYPQAAVEALFSQKPPELAAALEAALPEMKTIGRGGGLALADYYLLTAHTYAQVPGKNAAAAGYYKAAADLLGTSDFLPKGLDPLGLAKAFVEPQKKRLQELWDAKDKEKDEDKSTEIFAEYLKESEREKRNKDAMPKLEAALGKMRLWPRLRQAWIYYGELGIAGGDAESQKKGEALLAALNNPALAEQRPWLVPAGTAPKQAGTAQVTLEPWHPERTDKKFSCELPFLNKVHTFILTIKNGGAEPLEFNSDDIVISSAGAAELAALPVGDLTPDVLANGMNLQQFMFPELTPYTFSDMTAKEYNDSQLEINPLLAKQKWSADWQAKMDADVARAQARRAATAAGWAKTTGAIVNSMINNMNAIDARQDSQRASEARLAGNYRAAAAYENRARWAQDNIKYNNESRQRWDAVMDAEVAKAGQVKTMDGVVNAISPAAWDNSVSQKLGGLEAKITLRLAAKKLERFLNSDFMLPHKATNLRIPPGEAWTGLVAFNTMAGGYDALKLTTHQGGAAKETVFRLAEKRAWLVKPPALYYQPPLLVMVSMDFGSTSTMKAVDWNVMLPDLVFQ